MSIDSRTKHYLHLPYAHDLDVKNERADFRVILQEIAFILNTAIPSGVVDIFAKELGVTYSKFAEVIRTLSEQDPIEPDKLFFVTYTTIYKTKDKDIELVGSASNVPSTALKDMINNPHFHITNYEIMEPNESEC